MGYLRNITKLCRFAVIGASFSAPILTGATALLAPLPVFANAAFNTSLQNAIVAAGLKNSAIDQFYAARGFEPLWVGDKKRLDAFISAINGASAHALPQASYRAADVQNAVAGGSAQGELFATQMFIRYAQNIFSGVLEPRRIDREIDVNPPRLDERSLLVNFSQSNPERYIARLAPTHKEYVLLQKERLRLHGVISEGGFGAKVPAGLKPGSSGNAVVSMRARLERMGYGSLGASPTYDASLVEVVKNFQSDNGLNTDGAVGPATLKAMNTSAEEKLAKVVINMERQRWFTGNRGKRYVYVNIPDFSVKLYDNGRSTFYSRTVVGQVADHRTPEFSDVMTHMVINPTWHVPRSIAGKEYLPIIKKDPGFLARRNMRLVNSAGKSVDPKSLDLSKFGEDNFPYYIKQAPDPGNALGQVKFMFPNRHNIYLHDTPSKSLFNRDVRAFSHGCVRVQKPFDFAYALLAPQSSNPEASFKAWLNTGQEKYVNLERPIPVYVAYNTAWADDTGRINYRADIYGRDRKVLRALTNAGVAL